MIKAVVLDLGNVLVEWQPRNLYRKMFDGDEAAMEWFFSNVATKEWNHEMDRGRPYADAVYEKIHEFPEYKMYIEAWDKRWDEMLGGVITGTAQIMQELKSKNIPVYALTNWSAEKFPRGRERFPILDTFDGLVVSGEIGLVKPEPAIFQHLLKKFNLKPEETFFTDDAPENVEGARRLGIDAVLFKSPDQLRKDLQLRGIL